MTFKVCNLGSKHPYFNSAYVVRVPIFSFRTVGVTLTLTHLLMEGQIDMKSEIFILMCVSINSYRGNICSTNDNVFCKTVSRAYLKNIQRDL